MQFSTIFITLFISLAAASPVLEQRASLCSSALNSALCCETDVDGVLDLTCAPPAGSPKTTAAFEKACAKIGQGAQCCNVPLAGDALLCTAQ